MQAALQQFGELLRGGGLRVSSAEMLDALRATEIVGIGDPSRLKAALSATLVKRLEDHQTFSELFDLFFTGGRSLVEAAQKSSLSDWIGELALDDAARRELFAALAAELAEMSAMGRVAMGARAPDVASLVRAQALEQELQDIRSPLQVGFYTYRILEGLGVDDAREEARRAALRLAQAFAELPMAELEGLVESNLRDLHKAIRDFVEGQFRQHNPLFRQKLASAVLADKPLARLAPEDVVATRREVLRLARLLRARLSVRRRRAHSGTLDVSKTLRSSLATDGVPFELHLRRRPRRRPRLVILCDVSDSVRNVSLFMLQLVYLLQELWAGVRCFAFVAELADLSPLFRNHPLDRALELALSGDAVNVFANSNYGRSFEQFFAEHAGILNRRTTVLIIGDGRNNYHASRAEVLEQIRRRARSVIWINPEQRASWGFGDSAMPEYSRHCDRVAVAYNLRSLVKVVDDLLDDLDGGSR